MTGPRAHPISNAWKGHGVARARQMVAATLPRPCGQCGKTVKPTDRFVVGHTKPRWEYPELTWEPSNWRPEHATCSERSAQGEVIRKAKAEGARQERERLRARQGAPGSPCGPEQTQTEGPGGPVDLGNLNPGFPQDDDARESPLVFVPLPAPSAAREDLAWNPEAMEANEWLRPFTEVPEDASPPLWTSPPPPDAVGSYGASCIEWIEESQGLTLRWWQRLAITRQLEHREDGSLCHREVLESAPRRAGKSVRLRGMALWRMSEGPALFGETQLVMHTASDMQIAREVQRQAWRWAEEAARWKVSKANGKEAIETRRGDRWLVRSGTSVYGYDVTLGVADECWDVAPETISEGIEPATLERSSPQVHLTSTAHRRATSLMRGRLSSALAVADPTVLLLVWAAPAGSDPGDPEVWRAASPHWSEDRRRMIASKYAKALAGESDPQFDDPDPMAGFTSQYLNIWRLTERRESRGDQVTTSEKWGSLASLTPATPPTSAAIESWFEDGCSLALGWHMDGRAFASVTDHPDLTSAAAALAASGFRGVTTVGASLMEDPALKNVRRRKGEGSVKAAASELRRLLNEDAVRHDGASHLTDQVLAVRTVAGADGPRMASTGRADAVKVLVWVVREARTRRPTSMKILLPRS